MEGFGLYYVVLNSISCLTAESEIHKIIIIMPRGRKRKNVFIPRPWIPNSSSEDEHQGDRALYVPHQDLRGGGQPNMDAVPDRHGKN